jgi:hypothetical protein
VAGLGAGIGLAVFLSLLRPPFTTAQKLREITGVPVLGTVTMNWMPEVKRQKWLKLVAFGASFAALFLLFVGVVVLAVKGYHLPPLISKAV